MGNLVRILKLRSLQFDSLISDIAFKVSKFLNLH